MAEMQMTEVLCGILQLSAPQEISNHQISAGAQILEIEILFVHSSFSRREVAEGDILRRTQQTGLVYQSAVIYSED